MSIEMGVAASKSSTFTVSVYIYKYAEVNFG